MQYRALAHTDSGISLERQPNGTVQLGDLPDWDQSSGYRAIVEKQVLPPAGADYWLIINPEGEHCATLTISRTAV
jgi:hypothetical protein